MPDTGRDLCARLRTTIVVALAASTSGFLLSASPAGAHSYVVGSVQVGHVWVKPTEDTGKIAGIYGAIFNTGDKAVTIEAISSPIAERAGFCVEAEDGTKWIDTVDLEPQQVVAFAPWREHICLDGLKEPLKDGGRVPFTIDFGPDGKVDAEAFIEEAPTH